MLALRNRLVSALGVVSAYLSQYLPINDFGEIVTPNWIRTQHQRGDGVVFAAISRLALVIGIVLTIEIDFTVFDGVIP